MRKFSLYAILVAVCLAAGCNKERYETAIPGENDWIYDASLPVPIKFGISQSGVETKAGIVNTWDDVDKNFAIFGLPKNSDIPWTNATGGKIIWNEDATITENGILDLGGPESDFYYPANENKTNYSFFGFYPKDAATSVDLSSDNNSVNATVTIDGKTDLMWAMKVAKPITEGGKPYDGYNARYIRKNGAQQPELHFKHLLSALKIEFQYGGVENNLIESAQITIDSLTIKDFVSSATLSVAQRDTTDISDNCGKLTDLVIEDHHKIVPDDSWAIHSDMSLWGKDSTEVYSTLLFYPDKRTYTITVAYTYGTEDHISMTFDINCTDGFLPANIYTLTIKVNGNNGVILSAKIDKWIESGKGTYDPDDDECNIEIEQSDSR